jgi:hypothetical protein
MAKPIVTTVSTLTLGTSTIARDAVLTERSSPAVPRTGILAPTDPTCRAVLRAIAESPTGAGG